MGPDPRYYYLSRRSVNTTLALLATLTLLGGLIAWTVAPLWLSAMARALDVDVPIANPQVVVVRANSTSAEIDRRVAAMIAANTVEAVVLMGSPFTSDVLVATPASRRIPPLVAIGVPREKIVEAYGGINLYEEFEYLRERLRARGWHRVLMLNTSPGTRRNYLVGRRILGEAGIEVGETTVPSPQWDPDGWWRDKRDRGRLVFGWMGLILSWVAGRY